MSGLRVFTSRKWFRDPDLLDVTRAGGDPIGLVFAPSWALLGDVKGFDGRPPAVGQVFEKWVTCQRSRR